MPSPLKRASSAVLLVAGLVFVGALAYSSADASLTMLALLAAAFILAEALQRADDDVLPEPLETERFSLATPVHIAALVLGGPWVGALVAVIGTWAVRPLRGHSWRTLVPRTNALVAAAVAAGFAFQFAGGEVDQVRLPEDLLPFFVMGTVYVAVRSLLIPIGSGHVAARPSVLTSSAEVGLGLGLAVAAVENLWQAAAIVPVLLLLDQVYGRIVVMRREMATALETFANIVDERDPSTHGHSVRVADYVRELAVGIGLPRSEVSRLWWAGRLHDLGKVAVDASLLRKPGKLTPAEWGTVWRAPRLSARLLQRFRFAAQQAQAVEYHRERYDGSGYYGARRDDMPLAAHFLIVADAYDAMTTDRPFRARLSEEEALAEIERGSGTQFHPMVARAFVAVRRGLDPATVVRAEELEKLRDASVPYRSPFPGPSELRRRPELVALAGGVGVLAGLGTRIPELVVAATVIVLGGIALWARSRFLAQRLGADLDGALETASDRSDMFARLEAALRGSWDISFAAFVAWDDDGSSGSVVFSRGHDGPPEPALISWLLREAESGLDVAVDVGEELGAGTVSVAVPVRRQNGALLGFLVFRGDRFPPPHLTAAVHARLDRFASAFADVAAPAPVRPGAPAPVALDANGAQHARPLEA
jgi:HD-GYP domain-containing protein (c-di-GMP phosphodiesterase class II)